MDPLARYRVPERPGARRRATVVAVVATLGLVGLVVLSFPLGGVLVLGGLACELEGRDHDALICTGAGPWLALALPVVGAVAGMVCAVVGWVSPHRRRWAWLAIGYAVALGAAGFGALVAAGAED